MHFQLVNRKRDKYAILFFIFFYIASAALLSIKQEKIIYQPTEQNFSTCSGFMDAIKTQLGSTRVYQKDINKSLVVFYHGNGGSTCDRAQFANFAVDRNYSYIFPEYTGYSNDEGVASHEEIIKNVEDVVRYIEAESYKEVLLIGESIGTLFASYHASLLSPDKLLLISPLTNLTDVARSKFWFYPVSLLTKDPLDNIILLESFVGDIVIMHGDSDKTISPKIGKKLYSSLKTPNKKFISIESKGHNDIFESPMAHEVLNAFLLDK
jgi:uncharacterized protein